MTRIATFGALCAVALAGCGRDVTSSDVKLLNVGNNPEDIGPAPTPYGGIVEFNHVDIAGGALPLGVMGLRGYTEIGPDLVGMAPPYQAVFGLSYLFDAKLRGATNLALVLPPPPAAAGACYTQYSPGGPFDSGFNTVDVGDYIDFRRADDDTRVARLDRIPRDYPPEASRLSTFYQVLEAYSPSPRTQLVPDPDGSPDPRDMLEVPYRFANFPFGTDVIMSFPGGFTSFDKPVASIPRPSTAVEPTELTLPEPIGGIQLSWDGPKWTFDPTANEGSGAWSVNEAEHSACFEFTDRTQWGDPATEPEEPTECESLTPYPRATTFYRRYRGQVYTGPWDTQSGVTFNWAPDESDDDIVLAVKFLAPVDPTDDAFVYRAGQDRGGAYERPARVCETAEETRYVFDDNAYGDADEVPYEDDGEVSVALQGNPSEVLAQVVCKLENTGEYTLTQDQLAGAFAYARERGGAGAVFMFGRSAEVDATIPPVKDPFDQIHDVNPVKVAARTVRIGRFYWDLPPLEEE